MGAERADTIKDNSEIDFDSIEIAVLIVGKDLSTLSQAATFLSRRGWPSTVLTDFTKAIEHITRHQPDFVLVSANHPDQAVFNMPHAVLQAFNIDCMAFAEVAGRSSD